MGVEGGRRRLRSSSDESRNRRLSKLGRKEHNPVNLDRGYKKAYSGHKNRRRSSSPSKYHGSCNNTRKRDPSSYRGRKDKDFSKSFQEKSTAQVTLKSKEPLPTQSVSYKSCNGHSDISGMVDEKPEKQKPNFAPTGLLAAESNSIVKADGSPVVLKYHEPPEARLPPVKDEWKLFVFKGSEILETIELSKKSCWLLGRDVAVVDMIAEHPSVSNQHAVIQFRFIERINELGDQRGKVIPYLIDLKSANGTLLNKKTIPKSRFVEIRDKDMIQLAHSTREYVLILSSMK